MGIGSWISENIGSPVGNFVGGIGDWLGNRSGGQTSKVPDLDRNDFNLAGQGGRDAFTSQQAAGAQGRVAPQAADSSFRGDQQALISRLRGQMSGQDSLSALQLRDATDANIAQQRSQAASASPGNAAMAQRLAMQNTGRMNQGYGAQAAQLGIQERNAAANALAGVAQGARGQDQQNNQFNAGAQLQQQGLNDQYGLGMSGLNLGNAQAGLQGSMGYGAQQTARRGQDLGQPVQPTNGERVIGAAAALAPLAMMSDERLKTNISTPSGGSLDSLMQHLKPQEFEYQDQRLGAGPRVGVMAQDVERGGRAGREMVSDVGGAKVLDVHKSLGTALGLIGRLGERLDHLEGHRPRAMADGGVVTQPTDAIVGEAGPEAILPLSKLSGMVDHAGAHAASDKAQAMALQGLKGLSASSGGDDWKQGVIDASQKMSQASSDPLVKGLGAIAGAYAAHQKAGAAKDAMQSSLASQANRPASGVKTSTASGLGDYMKQDQLAGQTYDPGYTFMAQGGIVTAPTRAVVGEDGPEAVIPLDQLPGLIERLGGIGARTKQTSSSGGAPAPATMYARPEELSRARPPVVRPEELYRARAATPQLPPPRAPGPPSTGGMYLHNLRAQGNR